MLIASSGFWMSDKPAVQHALAQKIADLVRGGLCLANVMELNSIFS